MGIWKPSLLSLVPPDIFSKDVIAMAMVFACTCQTFQMAADFADATMIARAVTRANEMVTSLPVLPGVPFMKARS